MRAPFKPVALVGFVPQHQDMSAGALPVVVGEIASLGTLLVPLEIIFAVTDEPFEKHAGRNTGNLLDGAKDSVWDSERLDDPAKQQLREPLARVKNLMNERGDFIHAVYTSQVGSEVDQVMRTRLKTGSKSPVVDVVSAADLVALAARQLDLICDLGTRSRRPSQIVALGQALLSRPCAQPSSVLRSRACRRRGDALPLSTTPFGVISLVEWRDGGEAADCACSH